MTTRARLTETMDAATTRRTRRTTVMTGTRWCWVVAAVLLAACGDSPPHSESPPPQGRLVVRIDRASAMDCPHGGSIVNSGIDSNGDNVLQDAEVVARTVVCNPEPIQPPRRIVIRLLAEPPGDHCRAGGTAVQSGPDQNGNGQLDDGEVSHIDYVCGQLLLTRLVAEPAGPNCIAGGVVFLAGRDRDGDGVLQDAEVETTELECGDVLSRDVEIRSDADVTALANIRIITGSVAVGFTNGLTSISLPRLERVGGALSILPFPFITELSLPALQEVGGNFQMGGMSAAACPVLHRVGRFKVFAAAVQDLGGFPALTEIDGDLEISESSALLSVDLPRMSVGGQIEMFFNDGLKHVTLRLVDRVGFVAITDNRALETLDLSVTPRQRTTTELGPVDVFSDVKLAHLALSADQLSSLNLGSDPVLADIALDIARTEFDVSIFDITVPFNLALSSPRAGSGIDFGSRLVISSPLAAIQSTEPVSIHGLAVFDKTRLQTLDLHSPLRTLGGVRFSDNALLTHIAPFTLDGTLQIRNNAILRIVSSVTLARPGEIGGMAITDNPVLSSVPFLDPVEDVRGGVDIERNPLLASVFGPALTQLDGPMFVDDNDSLVHLDYPRFEHLVSDLVVSNNLALETIEMPALTEAADELFIFTNAQLHHIALDSLVHSDFIAVTNNPRLPSCEVRAMFAHVTSLSHSQSGNDDSASCN